jgi:hypothetical protein
MRAVVAVLAVLLAGAPLAEAQPRHGGGADQAQPANKREKVKQRIRAMRAYALTEALSLDEQTAGKLFPTLARYDDETDKLLERRIELNRRLRAVDQMKDTKAIDRLIDDAIAVQRGFVELDEHRLTDLRKILTPAQTAKLLIVLPEFERRIQNQLRAAISKAARKGAAQESDDDDFEPDEGAPPKGASRHDPPSQAPGNIPPRR